MIKGNHLLMSGHLVIITANLLVRLTELALEGESARSILYHIISDYSILCYILLYHIILRYIILYYITLLCYIMSYHIIL